MAALGGYLLLATLLFLPAWAAPASRTVGGGGDPFLFTWYLRWIPYAVAHGWNPLLTTHLDYPDGVNLMWNTSIPLPSLILAPVTLTAGPLCAYNLLMTLGLALSGWCADLALRRYVQSGPAAFVGGVVYAFSPFMAGQSLGHPHLTLAVAPPLVLLILDDLLVRQRPTWWKGALLGALGAAQLLTGEEVLAIVAVATLIGLATLALLHPDAIRSRVRPALPVLAVAGVVFVLAAALPLGIQFLGPQRVHSLQPHNYYVSDALGFLLPTRLQLIAPAAATHLSDHFSGDVSQRTAYLGAPLLALLLLVARSQWRNPVVRWTAIMAGILAVLSLGSSLHLGGLDTGIPLPGALLDRVPLVREILPARYTLVLFLLVGILVAIFLGAAFQRPQWRLRAAGAIAVGLSLAALCPELPYPTSPAVSPAFFSRPVALRALPEGSVVLVAPFAAVGMADAMYWQAEAGMWFRMPEGEAFVPGPYPLYPPPSATEFALVPLAQTMDPPSSVDSSVARDIRADLRRWGVAAVVVGPMPHRDQAVALMSTVLGRAPEHADGVDVWWNVPAALAQLERYSLSHASGARARAL
jgi:hypothetical protein